MDTAFPVIHPGDYFEFGEGDTYARILILTPDTCLVKDGVGLGEIIPIKEWYFMTEWGTDEKIRRVGYEYMPRPQTRGILRTTSLPNARVIGGSLHPIVRYNNTVTLRTYSYEDSEVTLNTENKPRLCSGTSAPVEPNEADKKKSCCIVF